MLRESGLRINRIADMREVVSDFYAYIVSCLVYQHVGD